MGVLFQKRLGAADSRSLGEVFTSLVAVLQVLPRQHPKDVEESPCGVNDMTNRLIYDLSVNQTWPSHSGLRNEPEVVHPPYNHTLVTTMVQYASAVYMSDLAELFTWTCSRCNGFAKGFEVIELIVDVQNCLQTILMPLLLLSEVLKRPVYRTGSRTYSGSSSTLNIPAAQMGRIVFLFMVLQLIYGSKNVQVMTFGMPRIGNAAFASYYSEVVPNTFRMTHEHDLVPHLPPYYQYFPQKTYHHFPREVWIYNLGLGFLIYQVEKGRKSEELAATSRLDVKSLL